MRWYVTSEIEFCNRKFYNELNVSQVFVYEPEQYRLIRERLRQKGIDKIPRAELNEYFSPLHTRHIGRILSASGNETVELWANRKLQLSPFPTPFVSLLKLHANSNLLHELDGLLGNEALLKLNLKTLAPAFRDGKKRDWFHEVLDNNLKLWGLNMWIKGRFIRTNSFISHRILFVISLQKNFVKMILLCVWIPWLLFFFTDSVLLFRFCFHCFLYDCKSKYLFLFCDTCK